MGPLMTKHSCQPEERAFGRRVKGCPRCLELAQGASPRAGWQKGHYEAKARREAQEHAWIERSRKEGLCYGCGAKMDSIVQCGC